MLNSPGQSCEAILIHGIGVGSHVLQIAVYECEECSCERLNDSPSLWSLANSRFNASTLPSAAATPRGVSLQPWQSTSKCFATSGSSSQRSKRMTFCRTLHVFPLARRKAELKSDRIFFKATGSLRSMASRMHASGESVACTSSWSATMYQLQYLQLFVRSARKLFCMIGWWRQSRPMTWTACGTTWNRASGTEAFSWSILLAAHSAYCLLLKSKCGSKNPGGVALSTTGGACSTTLKGRASFSMFVSSWVVPITSWLPRIRRVEGIVFAKTLPALQIQREKNIHFALLITGGNCHPKFQNGPTENTSKTHWRHSAADAKLTGLADILDRQLCKLLHFFKAPSTGHSSIHTEPCALATDGHILQPLNQASTTRHAACPILKLNVVLIGFLSVAHLFLGFCESHLCRERMV